MITAAGPYVCTVEYLHPQRWTRISLHYDMFSCDVMDEKERRGPENHITGAAVVVPEDRFVSSRSAACLCSQITHHSSPLLMRACMYLHLHSIRYLGSVLIIMSCLSGILRSIHPDSIVGPKEPDFLFRVYADR